MTEPTYRNYIKGVYCPGTWEDNRVVDFFQWIGQLGYSPRDSKKFAESADIVSSYFNPKWLVVGDLVSAVLGDDEIYTARVTKIE